MNKPNAFVIGAPKCGTTALCHYLGQHPEVFVCEPKEPHFFAHEDMPKRLDYYKDLDGYLELFSGATVLEKTILEGSVWYLYSERAVSRIAAFDANAKLIVMLRRPDEMVYSFHSQALASFDEDIQQFSKAWEMALNPKLRQSLPPSCKEPSVLQYNKIACYGEQLERVYEHFPRSQVHVIFYEDFSQNTMESYQNVLSFLGVADTGHAISFEKVNQNSVVRNRLFGRYLEHPPPLFMKLWNAVKGVVGAREVGLRQKLLALNSKTVARQEIDESTRTAIIKEYRADILKLQNLTGRDLSHWMQ